MPRKPEYQNPACSKKAARLAGRLLAISGWTGAARIQLSYRNAASAQRWNPPTMITMIKTCKQRFTIIVLLTKRLNRFQASPRPRSQ
jgi:hypothetical protein